MEQITSWNRLEGRPRAKEFDRSLRCQIRDPLWMLSRQWQMGEFEAEDNGSPVSAKINWEYTALQKVSLNNQTPSKVISDKIPLEAEVEQVKTKLDLYLRIEMGSYWKKLLIKKIPDSHAIIEAFKDQQELQFKLPGDATPQEKYDNAYLLDNRALIQLLTASKRQLFIDGGSLYEYLKSSDTNHASDFLTSPNAAVDDVGKLFVNWFERRYSQALGEMEDAWKPEKLEYQFACAVAEESGAPKVFYAEEYYQGALDWYAFDLFGNSTATNVAKDLLENLEFELAEGQRTLIPAEVEFSGMPHTRWWQFEDGQVNLTALSANLNESSTAVFAEFGLIYGNDWFFMPLSVPTGSFLKIKDIVVRDVFGQQTLIKHYDETSQRNDHWAFLKMFERSAGPQSENRLFLPPVVLDSMKGKPLEQIHFMRDEMANMVWGIESIIPDGLGAGVNGYEYAYEIKRYFEKLSASLETAPERPLNDNNAKIKYQLGTKVPENWIPFVPARLEGSDNEILLQRAAMPRIVEGFDPRRIRPLTGLLRFGLTENPADRTPYKINEEEVPRSGANVVLSWQRARWYNGAVVLWLGYRKQNGRGEGNSGLVFDQIVPK